MILNKTRTLGFALLLSAMASAYSVDDITTWSELGSNDVDYLQIANDLGIEDVEMLEIDDPKFKLLMDTIKEASNQAPTNPDLNNKKVSLLGFIAPLNVNEKEIESFLLVPYEGACIHMPPPPQNNVVYIELDEDKHIPIEFYYEAIKVQGTLKIEQNTTALANSAYALDAENIEIAPIEAVFQIQ